MTKQPMMLTASVPTGNPNAEEPRRGEVHAVAQRAAQPGAEEDREPGRHAAGLARGGGAGQPVVEREAEAGARDRRDGDAARAVARGQRVERAQVGEEVRRRLGEIARGREVEAGARGRVRPEAEPDLVRARRRRRRAGARARGA